MTFFSFNWKCNVNLMINNCVFLLQYKKQDSLSMKLVILENTHSQDFKCSSSNIWKTVFEAFTYLQQSFHSWNCVLSEPCNWKVAIGNYFWFSLELQTLMLVINACKWSMLTNFCSHQGYTVTVDLDTVFLILSLIYSCCWIWRKRV